MGYKVLGFIVWRGARWYMGRRYPDAGKKLAIGGAAVGALAVGAAVAAGARQRD